MCTCGRYAHAGPSMHYLQSRYAVERPSRAHPLRSTPHARGRNREVFLPDVTLDSCFMQRRMWRDHHRMQRHVLERERDVEALHSQVRSARRDVIALVVNRSRFLSQTAARRGPFPVWADLRPICEVKETLLCARRECCRSGWTT